MKVYNISNTDKFFEAIDSTEGKVYLTTAEGDRINLKSKLAQYVAFANIFSNPAIPEVELLFSNPEDAMKIMEYCYYSAD